ncbi:uncharacterized protein V6R79_017124 [Siganus canaliculatus]
MLVQKFLPRHPRSPWTRARGDAEQKQRTRLRASRHFSWTEQELQPSDKVVRKLRPEELRDLLFSCDCGVKQLLLRISNARGEDRRSGRSVCSYTLWAPLPLPTVDRYVTFETQKPGKPLVVS